MRSDSSHSARSTAERRHGLEVVRAVEVRRAVHARGADFLKRPKVLVVVVLAAVEHQVLEQVGEAGLAGHLVLRADVIPNRDGDDRRLAVLVHDDAQAVVEIELVERNLRVLRDGRAATSRGQDMAIAREVFIAKFRARVESS